MGLLIDTSVLIDLERSEQGDSQGGLLDLGKLTDEEGFLAAITVSELLHGVHRASGERIRARREAFVNRCLDLLPTLPFGRRAAEIHSRIWSDLQESGMMIGGHDLLIAATALEYDLPLLTGNLREFERVGGLEVVAWKAPTD